MRVLNVDNLPRATLLFVEDTETTEIRHVHAHEVANILRKYDVRCVITNACQSAALLHNFSRTLVQEGISMVLGMQYKLLETAAEIVTTALYQDLLGRGRSMADACSNARSKLRQNRGRRTNYNITVDVVDYMNPVLFMAEHFQELDFQPPAEQRRLSTWFKAADDVPVVEGLLGRESFILGLENDLLTVKNVAFLSGSAGSGKSALAEHMSWWWKATGLIEGTLRVDFAKNNSIEWGKVTQTFCNELGITNQELVPYLQSHRHLILFDSIEELEHGHPPKFLVTEIIQFTKAIRKCFKKSRTASLILFIGRDNSSRMRKETAASPMPLGGLDLSSSLRIAFNILESKSKTLDSTDKADAYHMEEIVSLLNHNPLAIELVMSDFASRSEKPTEYYARLTSNKKIEIHEEMASKRSVEQALQLLNATWEYAPFVQTIPQKHMKYLSPFWNVIPAKNAPYWKFLELAFKRIRSRQWAIPALQKLKTVAETMDGIEEALFVGREPSADIFDSKGLDHLDEQFGEALTKISSTGLLGEAVSMDSQLPTTKNFTHYRIHPVLTIGLRSTIDDVNTANPDTFVIPVAYARFYDRQTIVAWRDVWEHSDMIRKQIDFQFENYVTYVNMSFSIDVTDYDHNDPLPIIRSLFHHSTHSPRIALPLLDRGIDYFLSAARKVKPDGAYRAIRTLEVLFQKTAVKVMEGFDTPTGYIDKLPSLFCIIGMSCTSYIIGALVVVFRYGLDPSRYINSIQELKTLSESDSRDEVFRDYVAVADMLCWVHEAGLLLRSYKKPYEASLAAVDTFYATVITASASMSQSGTCDEHVRESIRNSTLESDPVDPLLNEIIDLWTFQTPRPTSPELKQLEEKAHKLLQKALQRRGDPLSCITIRQYLLWVSCKNNDIGRVEEHMKALRSHIDELPKNREPWISYMVIYKEVEATLGPAMCLPTSKRLELLAH